MSINKKFIVSISLLICLFAAVLVVFQVTHTITSVHQTAQQHQQEAVEDISRLLDTTDSIMLQRVKSSMNLLKERSLELGSPSIKDTDNVSGKTASNLYFGDNKQTNQYELVDNLTNVMGGTATLFSRINDEYVRISTNVKKDGKRATGTVLAPTGKAALAIGKGQSFYGEVDILGQPYIAGYEPIMDSGKTIGIWYVGYSADMKAISDAVNNARVLEQGFVALMDGKGQLRMFSGNTNADAVSKALADKENWNVSRTVYTPWGYEIVSAYPNTEINSMIWNASLQSISMVLAIGIVLIVFISMMVQRIVGKPLKVYVDAIHNLADGEGDLTKRFEQHSKDELGTMALGFNNLLDRIHETIKHSKSAAEDVSQSANQLLALASKSLNSISSQNKDTEQVAAASHEMSISALDIAKNTADAEKNAYQANQDVHKVGETLTTTIRSIEHQASNIESSNLVVQELVDASDSISKVLTVIRDIADQTNLLALNAAIEAARAGEQGRGFAVVADEVRLLASRTQTSTEEIRKMVERLQHSGNQASEQMNTSRKAAENNVAQARAADEVLRTVLSSVNNISQLNAEIASAVEQQRFVAEDVSKNINLIREASDQNLNYSSETTQACKTLSTLAENLNSQLSHYKV
ncbi:methyl-accepting chemotaxis protein [Vibrio ziniensis]|uniref:Methyl-accepting chemotaxis protein n=1 Tax=Vibrio ziniensis TaxID=2711221 RepID=A0A6G7CJJ1_9VIBR|nr:Cache 3/Cache 2 fusion domain-containing protein [Vibrio ziniensis]QIH42216.1 methyl-accepting chemotaxis protein [Vibrio ziniensis]